MENKGIHDNGGVDAQISSDFGGRGAMNNCLDLKEERFSLKYNFVGDNGELDISRDPDPKDTPKYHNLKNIP